MRLHLTVLAIVVALVFGAYGFLHAQTGDPYENNPEIQELNKKIKEKEEEIANLEKAANLYEDKIDQAAAQSATLQNQLQLLDNQITKIELDIKTTQSTIDRARLDIKATEYQIEKEEAEITAQKEKLREYIKLIDKEDQKSLLEILLVNNSFSEFFTQLNYIEEIQADLKKSVDRVKLLKETLELKKANLEIYQDTLEEKKVQLEESQLRLKEQIQAKEVLLFETKHSEIKFQRLLTEAQQIQREVDSSITNIEEEIKRKIARLRSGNTDPKTTLVQWPVDPSRGITAYFYDPTYPYRSVFEHNAIDIRAYQGTRLQAPADGYVARARDNGYGYSYITLIHDNGLSTVYGHVSAIYVQADQFVQAGDVIGLSGGMPGTRGAGNFTTGPHLHFEVRKDGIPVDPLLYLP